MSVTGLTRMHVQWSVSRKVLGPNTGTPKLMTHQPDEEIAFFMHKQSHKKTNALCPRFGSSRAMHCESLMN